MTGKEHYPDRVPDMCCTVEHRGNTVFPDCGLQATYFFLQLFNHLVLTAVLQFADEETEDTQKN